MFECINKGNFSTHTHTQVRFAEKKIIAESGRSMVEMLGALTIIGILSMVGIKAFNAGMTQHRANELINEAQKRAVVVAAQVMAGRDNLSVAEFKNPDGYVFGVEKNPANSNQFNITVSGIDSEVCQKIKSMIEDSSIIRMISDNCTEFTFNNDLSRTTEAQCAATGKIWCAMTGYCSTTGDCCLSGDCTATSCPTGATIAGTGGSTGVFVNGTECKCSADLVYTGKKCETKPTSCSSWTNNECGKGYYCNFSYTSANLNGSHDGTNTNCYKDLTGTCTPISSETKPTSAEMTILTQAGFKSTFLVGPKVNWWTASSWCVSQGKSLYDVSQMECYRVTNDAATNNKIVQAGEVYTYCCKKDQVCQQSSWNTGQTTALWNGQDVLEGKEEEVAKFSEKIIALRKVYGEVSFWTASPANNTSLNSCNAFRISSANGFVYNNGRRIEYFALCK